MDELIASNAYWKITRIRNRFHRKQKTFFWQQLNWIKASEKCFPKLKICAPELCLLHELLINDTGAYATTRWWKTEKLIIKCCLPKKKKEKKADTGNEKIDKLIDFQGQSHLNHHQISRVGRFSFSSPFCLSPSVALHLQQFSI